jgi:allophanate hydrolase subunit 2
VPGPHGEWFAPDALRVLAEAQFHVEDESNRVGLRLRPEGGALRLLSADGDRSGLDSQGVVTGAVQVPPDGHPVVLLPDHATLGGYPVVAVVAAVDHGRLGQCAPGDTVQFVPLDLEEARRERRLQMRAMESAVVGHYPLAVD